VEEEEVEETLDRSYEKYSPLSNRSGKVRKWRRFRNKWLCKITGHQRKIEPFSGQNKFNVAKG
jgi:hypothetical protein